MPLVMLAEARYSSVAITRAAIPMFRMPRKLMLVSMPRLLLMQLNQVMAAGSLSGRMTIRNFTATFLPEVE